MKRRHAEFILMLAGACLLAKGGWDLTRYAAFQSHPEWYGARNIEISPGNSLRLLPVVLRSPRGLDELSDLRVVGMLEIPRLGMSVLVVDGDDEKKLGLAAGHLSRTAAFGQKGNAVIAGHRDTSFWPLRKIHIGDKIRIRAGKTYEYVVSSIRVVTPEDVSVLQSTTDRSLTLVTCYPFRYFGSAPKRFIVRATIPSS